MKTSYDDRLSTYEELALQEFLNTAEGDKELLDTAEKIQLIKLLDKAGARRWWGLRLTDAQAD